MKIYKYPIDYKNDKTTIMMPMGAEIIHVAIQRDDICLWACVDSNQKCHNARSFKVVGTGQEIDNEAVYLGTVHSGPFVWHVLEVSI